MLAILTGSCDLATGLDANDRERRELEAALLRWENAKLVNYDVQVERQCFCTLSHEPVRVRVRGSAILDAVYVRSGEEVPSHYAGLFPSVRGLFAVVADAIEREVDDLEVEYDTDFGFPIYIRVDPRVNTADDEYVLEAGDLRVR